MSDDVQGGCAGLSFIDLSPLSEVAEVHGHFLSGCAGLSGLDLSPLSQLTKVPWHFLEGCAGLTSLDLGPLSQVTEVQGDFLGGCIGLAWLYWASRSRERLISEYRGSFVARMWISSKRG